MGGWEEGMRGCVYEKGMCVSEWEGKKEVWQLMSSLMSCWIWYTSSLLHQCHITCSGGLYKQ